MIENTSITVLQEAQKYYPNINLRETIVNEGTKEARTEKRYFKSGYNPNTARKGGSWSIEGLKHEIVSKKMDFIVKWLKTNLIININHSNFTHSIYFKINDTNIRISDHNRKSFTGIDILLKWNMDTETIINQIKAIK